jgi:hypothetical protein
MKQILGRVPLTAEVLETIRPSKSEIEGCYRLDRLEGALPDWIRELRLEGSPSTVDQGKSVLLVASLRWWFEYCTALGLLLTGLGNRVEIAYLPFRNWFDPVHQFDLRRQRIYLHKALGQVNKNLKFHDLSRGQNWPLSPAIDRMVEEQTRTDVQYTLQRESINIEVEGKDQELYQLRYRRNCTAANAALELMPGGRFDVVIIPNGSILEFGIFYRIARHLNTPCVTIEFGEQRERMWIAQDDEVMRLDTTDLWDQRGSLALGEDELEDLKTLYSARKGGRIWANFARQWQAGESMGAQETRNVINLDPDKPVALLCTNVVGDSLALGRQVFTTGMADWLAKTVRHFAQRDDVQLVVRVHPGELLGAGHPSVEIVQSALPDLPPHVTVVPPESSVNTYDLIELTNLGLVYTTTVGMEMAMNGIPVIVSGMTHYRQKGFTYDPETMPEYVSTLDKLLRQPKNYRLPHAQVELAWAYAYRFFFEYPFSFPWHLIHFWDDIESNGMRKVRSEALDRYHPGLTALLGVPIRWDNKHLRQGELA